MNEIAFITDLYDGIKRGIVAAQAALQMKTSIEVNMKVSEVIGLLNAARGDLDALRERYEAAAVQIDTLKKEVAQLRQFEIDKQGYVRFPIGPDATVYLPVEDLAKGEDAPHKICAYCFQKSEIRFLNFAGYEHSLKVLTCPGCQQSIKAPHGMAQEIKTADGGIDLRGY